MDAAGLDLIVRGLLLLAEEKPELFSPHEVRSLHRCLLDPKPPAGRSPGPSAT